MRCRQGVGLKVTDGNHTLCDIVIYVRYHMHGSRKWPIEPQSSCNARGTSLFICLHIAIANFHTKAVKHHCIDKIRSHTIFLLI